MLARLNKCAGWRPLTAPACRPLLQGFPEGHTAPCWPIQQPGIGAHRNTRVKVGAAARLLSCAALLPESVAHWNASRLLVMRGSACRRKSV